LYRYSQFLESWNVSLIAQFNYFKGIGLLRSKNELIFYCSHTTNLYTSPDFPDFDSSTVCLHSAHSALYRIHL
jgi:hypothetical protein